MTISKIFPLLLSLGALACGPVSPPVASPAPDPADPLTLVRGSLRAAATAQETLRRANGIYAADVEILRRVPGGSIADGVVLSIADASADGWSAEATHVALAGRSCVMWYGRPGAVAPVATAHQGRLGEESPGRVVCDGDTG